MEFIGLEKPAEFWATQIINSEGYERVSQKENFIKSGYDIKMSSKELEKLYLN